MASICWLLVGLFLGYMAGWRLAHQTVAEECRRLGGFFVGRAVFKCQEIVDGR